VVISMMIVKMECDRDDSAFISVAATVRLPAMYSIFVRCMTIN